MWYNRGNQTILGDKAMADNNTLDDLILTDPEPEKGKSKGLLALLALIILLIIVGAILAKMIFSSSDEIKAETNKTEEQTVQTITDSNNESSSNTSTNIDLQDPDLAPLDDINESTGGVAATTEQVEGGIVEDGTPSKTKENNTQESKEKGNKEELKNDTNEVVLQEIKTEKSETKQEQPKKVTKPKPKPKPDHTKKVYGGHGTVYIQVGSFVKGPESSFIEKIRRAGFRFRIKEIDGKRRVYVGPFRSRQEAKSLLGIVRSKINPDAFIK